MCVPGYGRVIVHIYEVVELNFLEKQPVSLCVSL